MNYHIYNKARDGFELIGSVLHYGDAKAVLDRYAAGYIADSTGATIKQKNL